MKPELNENARAPLNLDFALTDSEKRSEVWGKVFRACEARIHKLRVQNDSDQDDAKTAAIRTEIKVLKGILKNDPSREFSAPRLAVTSEDLAAGE